MKRISITFIMAISLAASVHAQEVLTLDRCYSMALENNKELKSAKVTLEKTGYDKKSAKSLFFQTSVLLPETCTDSEATL